MAEALVSRVLEKLASIMTGEIGKEVRLLVGARKEVERLTGTFKTIRAVLNDAEKREAKEEAVQTWLDELKDASYDMEDVLDEWSTAILKSRLGLRNNPWPKMQVCWTLSPCLFQVFLRHSIAHKITDINERLDEIVERKNRFKFMSEATPLDVDPRPKTTSLIDMSEVHGREQEKKDLLSRLSEMSFQTKQHPPIISIVGMGGIGKTTLAQLAFNDPVVKNNFELRIWVCVSNFFDLTRIARAIIEGIDGSIPHNLETERLLRHISEKTKNKKLLLVLDDVWTENFAEWEPLRNSLIQVAQGSRILVTTRSMRVAKMMGSSLLVSLEGLPREECWLIFRQLAFFERSGKEKEALEDIGKRIADRCKGLPLAAKVLGGLMRFKNSKKEWQNVLDSDLWDLEAAKEGIISSLWLSYYSLPSAMKQCLSYCASFPKDYQFYVEELIQHWMANGFIGTKSSMHMEAIGEEYFNNLAMRSLFQEFRKDSYTGRIYGCKMHDIVHDFVQFISKEECHVVEVYKKGTEEMRSDRLSGGKLRHLNMIYEEESPLSVPNFINNKGLHTLLLSSRGVSPSIKKTVLTGIVCKLIRLRVLALRHVYLEELPKELDNLIHLRYLNIEHTPLKALPETFCSLINMQSLILFGCSRLKKLPRGIDKLINLRHLVFDHENGITRLPKAVGQLSSLRTLSTFIVSPDNNDDSGGKYCCKMEDLAKLNLLEGNFIISGLENVGDAEEAKRAELQNKIYLHSLGLKFNASATQVAAVEAADDAVRAGRDLAVMEALEPPPQLVSLWISGYKGPRLPSWITSLTNLKYLILSKCPNLDAMPHDIRGLQLEKLEVEDCPSLQQRLGPNGADKLLKELWKHSH